MPDKSLQFLCAATQSLTRLQDGSQVSQQQSLLEVLQNELLLSKLAYQSKDTMQKFAHAYSIVFTLKIHNSARHGSY